MANSRPISPREGKRIVSQLRRMRRLLAKLELTNQPRVIARRRLSTVLFAAGIQSGWIMAKGRPNQGLSRFIEEQCAKLPPSTQRRAVNIVNVWLEVSLKKAVQHGRVAHGVTRPKKGPRPMTGVGVSA